MRLKAEGTLTSAPAFQISVPLEDNHEAVGNIDYEW